MNCNNCGKSITSGVGYCSECADEIQRIKAERDAAVRDLEEIMRNDGTITSCEFCVNYVAQVNGNKNETCQFDESEDRCLSAKWRGVQK